MAQFESLKTYLSKYRHKDVAQGDIVRTISQYKDLRPSSAPFVFNDGSQKQLVHLDGTIPVNYRGNTYNIPIDTWILDTHPYNPPIVYVKPTNTMQIKKGNYVDANGKIDLPYLREWQYPSSDLLSLIQVLTVTFGEECPVFSRSQQRQPAGPQYPSSTPYPTNPTGMPMPGPIPPYPSSAGMNRYPGQMSYPPYPGPNPAPYPSSGTPYPPYPPSTQSGGSSYPTPYPPVPNNPAPPYPPVQQSATQGYPSTTPGYPAPTYNPAYPTPTSTATERPQLTPQGTVTEADIKASLLSAVEDKMRRRLKETFAQAQAEMDVLTKTQTDLTSGKQKLETIMADLEKEKDEIEKNIQLLTEKDREVKEAIQKMQENENVDIDEAVVTTTPLYRQLVDAFAEEQAIEDAIYYLGEGLRKNVIELESFLKRVRELSRRQFMLRATIQKCREKAGLPPLA